MNISENDGDKERTGRVSVFSFTQNNMAQAEANGAKTNLNTIP